MVENVRELMRYRALVVALVGRHLATRYRGSVLGFLWSLLNPLCFMLIYTLVFHFYMRIGGVEHYAVFVFCGLLPWIWTSASLVEGTSSIVSSGHLVTKSMFPPQVLPAVTVLSNLVNFLLALPVLALFLLLSGIPFGMGVLSLPLLLVLHALLLFGCVLALAPLNVRYRDVQHVVANVVNVLFFLCPIIYPVDTVPERFRFTLELNPFAQVTMWYQHALLKGGLPPLSGVLYLSCWVALVLLVGNMIFTSHREGLAERL